MTLQCGSLLQNKINTILNSELPDTQTGYLNNICEGSTDYTDICSTALLCKYVISQSHAGNQAPELERKVIWGTLNAAWLLVADELVEESADILEFSPHNHL